MQGRKTLFCCSLPVTALLCAMVLVGCTGGEPIPPMPPGDLSGVWAGTWSGTDPVFGPVSGNWEAEINTFGYRFGASTRLSGDVDCPDGEVAGFAGVDGVVEGEGSLTLTPAPLHALRADTAVRREG